VVVLRILIGLAVTLALTWAVFVAALVVLKPNGIDLNEAKRLVPDLARLLRALAGDRALRLTRSGGHGVSVVRG